ncbi:hypothetical protein K466DRAFT_493052 [Polyporus arcularius HHB13444]|uniref:Uncharacterized protein n=1 Tax=Polyporus arcularius HHB13444 TaxID=1314778 RepID=A0A5C3PBL0_9APHY|nr:hypothetical protein K466DRAFT_493052 [Polyporus arcularius HHB13444]
MHLITLNLTDLIVSLLRGTLKCYEPDDKGTWDFAVFKDKEAWKIHGKLVANASRYLPGSFDRPPRDPAKKISSGFKAWEFLLYVYGLLPGLLRHILPPDLYDHFCTLVAGVRVVLQHVQHPEQLPQAHANLVEYVTRFEDIYYDRRAERLHFVRPCLHTLLHVVPETIRVGPGPLHSQWTLENFIGNITREIKQHVTPYANVSERAYRRCQVNAIKAIIPALADPEPSLPPTSLDLNNGYSLLRARDRSERGVTAAEGVAIHTFLRQHEHLRRINPGWSPEVRRWARLALPNGQVACSAWKEIPRELRGKHPRHSRMLRGDQFAEVQYYFPYKINGVQQGLAMVAPFSAPNAALLQSSRSTLVACTHPGDAVREVISAKDIVSVVAMVPLPMTDAEAREPNAIAKYASRYFVVEKPGLDIAWFAGRLENPAMDDDGFHID